MNEPGRYTTRSRRSFLRLAVIGIGGAFLLVAGAPFDSSSIKKGIDDLTDSVVAPNDSGNSRASLITVRVYYSMMAQYVALGEEEYVLQTPATLQTLIDTCIVRHPSVAEMVGTMLLLLDGVPSRPTSTLKDGDTVQFIPMVAGG